MLYDDMNMSRLTVHAQSMEEAKIEENNKEWKSSRSDEPSQPMIKKRFYYQESPMFKKYEVSNSNDQGKEGGFSFENLDVPSV